MLRLLRRGSRQCELFVPLKLYESITYKESYGKNISKKFSKIFLKFFFNFTKFFTKICAKGWKILTSSLPPQNSKSSWTPGNPQTPLPKMTFHDFFSQLDERSLRNLTRLYLRRGNDPRSKNIGSGKDFSRNLKTATVLDMLKNLYPANPEMQPNNQEEFQKDIASSTTRSFPWMEDELLVRVCAFFVGRKFAQNYFINHCGIDEADKDLSQAALFEKDWKSLLDKLLCNLDILASSFVFVGNIVAANFQNYYLFKTATFSDLKFLNKDGENYYDWLISYTLKNSLAHPDFAGINFEDKENKRMISLVLFNFYKILSHENLDPFVYIAPMPVFSPQDLRKKQEISAASKALSQYKFKKKEKIKKDYHLPLTKKTKAALMELSALENMSEAKYLEKIINEAYSKTMLDSQGKIKY